MIHLTSTYDDVTPTVSSGELRDLKLGAVKHILVENGYSLVVEMIPLKRW